VRLEIIALSLGRSKPFFDGAVLQLPYVNRDWAGQAAGPAMSACPVSDGRPEKGGLSRWAKKQTLTHDWRR